MKTKKRTKMKMKMKKMKGKTKKRKDWWCHLFGKQDQRVVKMERIMSMKNKHKGNEHEHEHKHEHKLVERMEREAIMIMKNRIDEGLRMREESEHECEQDNLPLPLTSGIRSQPRKRSPQQLTEAAAVAPASLHPPQHKRETPPRSTD
jgi:hypothetical protein